ncbi:MAG TPA: radical SAM protein [Spirochaetota bacterium]|nr:radical SAM protein [Spirochaetota bacterium]HPR47076.1 radical SAM protein [Spirochaetota bacterium]
MKILLINPPRSPENSILRYAPEEAKRFIHKKLIGPPLGLITLAAAVKDFDVTVFDMKGEYDLVPDAPGLDDMVAGLVRQHRPQIVGVTVIASEYGAAMDILRTVKKLDPEILTVAGGLHPTLCPDDFHDPCLDILCPGQSANLFRQIVLAREKNGGYGHIGGIMVNREGRLYKTTAPLVPWDPARADYIMPDRAHLKRWISTYRAGGSPYPSTYVFTSLGCPYRCSFCSIWPLFDGKYYQRDVESVITELKSIDDYPIVRFADANTIVGEQFISTLFDRIEQEGIKKTYIMDIRFDTAVKHPRLIEKLARGGLKVVICGIESFRQEELERYNKASYAHLIGDAIRIFHENDIMVRGNYVVPSDYDEDDFEALAGYAASHAVVYAGYTILTPMPGTEYYREVRDRIVDHDLSKYNFFNCVFRSKLPLETFYEKVGSLWLIKKGTDVI